eukprot:CAMPEP_0116919702 /NCGR_PEP_ID=MMETSP0467-20121206/20553_1 /TAXON_ID=283647 /ORGANISM="Mesodinium pulex, Strain SPMC105" /LENGTH=71 /DNA_ID=CAMNT_0004597351 /DNA_START=283 /DNA_END=498 /DNA_ORIENTATION=+
MANENPLSISCSRKGGEIVLNSGEDSMSVIGKSGLDATTKQAVVGRLSEYTLLVDSAGTKDTVAEDDIVNH